MRRMRRSTAAPPRKVPALGILIGAGVCLIAFIALIVLVTRTDEQKAAVEALNWTYSIPIEQLEPVEKEDWLDEIPGEAEILNCGQGLRTTESEPVPNSIEVCGTPYTIDTGSGYGEVVQDCEYEVYDDYCSYTIMDWVVFDTITESGEGQNPFWPEVTLLDGQREGERESAYAVIFLSGDKRYTYHADSLQEFQRYTPGSAWVINVNTLGAVVSVESSD
jgi:hypothetical protein